MENNLYLSGVADPTTATVGFLGQTYVNTTANTYFICTDITGIVYTWVSSSPITDAALLWDATTNTPTLVSSVGTEGDVYIVSVAGNTILNGFGNWLTGQAVIFTAGGWTKQPALQPLSIPYSNSVGNLISDANFLASDAPGKAISINDASTTTSVDAISIKSPFNASIEVSNQAVGIFKSYANAQNHFSTYSLGARGTKSAPLIVNNGDVVGSHYFGGYDGATFRLSSAIVSRIDGVPSLGNIKSNLEFSVASGMGLVIRSDMYGQYNDLFRVTKSIATGAVPATVFDPQMFFYPGKAAFRAGQVNGVQWNNSIIGTHSSSFGENCTASGSWSFSSGQNTTAAGNWSFSSGQNTTALGNWSFAALLNASASAIYSAAMGLNAIASFEGAIALGGFGSVASGQASATMGGNGNTSSGVLTATVGGGLNTNAGTFSTIVGSVGCSTASGVFIGTIIGGQGNLLTGTSSNSTAIGSNCTISNNNVVMVGASSIAMSSTTDQTFIINAPNGTGVSTNTPISTLSVNGTVNCATVTVSADFTTSTTKCKAIFVNTTTLAITITLASTDAVNGREYFVKDKSNNAFTNNITITPNGGKTINGVASVTITVSGGSFFIFSDGTNWYTN
jgi:hypothetical protein